MNATVKKTKDNGRDRLIASATTLFCEKGYHAVSVREICDHASANPSLISFHFGGKEALLETLFEKIISGHFDEMGKILSNPESATDVRVRLTLFFTSYVDFYLKNSEIVSLYLDELEKDNQFARELLPQSIGKIWTHLVEFLEQAQIKGLIEAEVDIKVLAFSLISPIGSTMRSKRSVRLFSECTLSDLSFREKLIKQIVDSIKLA